MNEALVFLLVFFAGMFAGVNLAFYMVRARKESIDSYMTEREQRRQKFLDWWVG